MKRLILDILDNPITILIIGLMLLAYGMLLLLLVRRNDRFAELVENISVRFLIFCQSELMITPFVHWSSFFLIVPPFNEIIAYSQFLIYAFLFFALYPKIKEISLQNFQALFLKSLTANPFIWLLPILAAVSFLWSETPLIALKSGLVLLGINLFSFYVSIRFDWYEIFSFIRWNTALIALLSLVFRRTTNASTTEGGGLAGVLPSKNSLGALMALGVILWLLHSLEYRKQKLLSISMFLVCLLVLFQSRSAAAYLVLVILMAVTLSGLFLKLFEFRSVAILTSILFLGTIGVSSAVVLNLERILGLFGKDLTFTGRNRIWPVVMEAISQKTWLGYGNFSFWQPWRDAENPALKFWESTYWVPPSSHQGFLDILLQLGVIGLVVMTFCLSLSLIQSMDFFFRQKGILAVLPLTVVLHNLAVNLPETRFLRPNAFWVAYVIVALKLTIFSSQTFTHYELDPTNKLADAEPKQIGSTVVSRKIFRI